MGKKEKLIKKLMSAPKDFTFEEAVTLLGYFSYVQGNKGKTSGSRVVFSSTVYPTKIIMHKPHPSVSLQVTVPNCEKANKLRGLESMVV